MAMRFRDQNVLQLNNERGKLGSNNENKNPGLRCVNETSAGINQKRVVEPWDKGAHRAPLACLDQQSRNDNASKKLPLSQNACWNFLSKPLIDPVPLPRHTFTVFHDENEENVPVEPTCSANQAKSTEGKNSAPRQPLATLSGNFDPDHSEDNAMVVDEQSESEIGAECEVVEASHKRLREGVSEEYFVEEYSEEIYTYMRGLETRLTIKPNYMRKQNELTHSMRNILVDWLVEVSEEYRLQTETLYLAINYIDRFLSRMAVAKSKLQLVGTASMLIAAKYEEIHPPEVEEFVFITDDTYTQAQVVRMEQVILKILDFDLAFPTAHWFLEKYSYTMNIDEQCFHLAMYLSELSLLEGDTYLQYKPSIVAGSALCLACHTLDVEVWPAEMTKTCGYSLKDFRPCMDSLLKTFQNISTFPQQAITDKYRKDRFSAVANLTAPLTLPF